MFLISGKEEPDTNKNAGRERRGKKKTLKKEKGAMFRLGLK